MENNQTLKATTSTNIELLGAVDIVEAFTSLRHELKLQVRGGRELQQSLQDSLLRLEQRVVTSPAVANANSSPEIRKMAEAIADIEESLQRAIESIIQKPATVRSQSNVLSRYDAFLSKAPWLARVFASRWFEDLRAEIAHSLESERKSSTHDATHRGLELLAARVHRLMKQFEIERVNVLHQVFDAETMNAIDVIVDPSVPSTHVAQQLRPLYRWRNSTLRCAEVRVAS
jgi:hypothetical protein